MSDFPKKLEVVLSASDQIIAWGLAIAFVAALYLVAFVIGYGLTGLLFPRPSEGKDDTQTKKRELYDRAIALYEKYGVYKGPRDE
jgi:hypothetical protein